MLRPSLDMGEPFTVSTDITDEEGAWALHGHHPPHNTCALFGAAPESDLAKIPVIMST